MMIDHNCSSTVSFLALFLGVVLFSVEYNFVIADNNGEIKCIKREREALLRFKNGLIDDNDILSSWGIENTKRECCEWTGVLCSNTTGHVISLRLNINGYSVLPSGTILHFMLRGNISSSLLELPHLGVLDLSGQDFGGNKIPEFIGSLKRLYYLNLGRSSFSGVIPSQLGNLTSLRYLSLDNNKLTGPLPGSSGQLSKLERLDLSFNSLEGTISEAHFTNLHNLESLNLGSNSLTVNISSGWNPPFQLGVIQLGGCKMGPQFPTWLQTQKSVRYLDISSAGILDKLPEWFWSWWSWFPGYLNLSNNQISGTIPYLWSSLDVSSNNFSGPIPLIYLPAYERQVTIRLSRNMFSGSISSICESRNEFIILLDLSDNHFTGEIPRCWETMAGLLVLNLANNEFSGEIPLELGSLSRLLTLYLRNNNLSGELPLTLSNCTELELIDFGGNMLTGNVPRWIASFSKSMMYINFGRNRFYGSIPPQICNLTLIQILDLSGNNISGTIPRCFDRFTQFVDVNSSYVPQYRALYQDYASVLWKGQESEYTRNMKLLKLVDLSSNQLVGNIPGSFTSLKGLISLNLSSNHLSGDMSPDIGHMESLEVLDLSSNQLSGAIPIGLGNLHFLAVLDLGNNNLSGKIPPSTQLQSFNASSFAGNIGLCGRPLPLCPGDGPPDQPSTNNNKDGEMDEGIPSFPFLKGLVISITLGFIIGFWGVVVPLILKVSWRRSYYNFWDAVGGWLYVHATLILTKLGRRS